MVNSLQMQKQRLWRSAGESSFSLETKTSRISGKALSPLALVAWQQGMMLPVSAAAATALDVENAATLEADEWICTWHSDSIVWW